MSELSRKAPVAWYMLCQKKSSGSLDILDSIIWNKAAITKLLWALMQKKDRLWVIWVHRVYIKRDQILVMDTPKHASWVVRKIFDARKIMPNGNSDLNSYEIGGKYSINKAYRALQPAWPKVPWKQLVFERSYTKASLYPMVSDPKAINNCG